MEGEINEEKEKEEKERSYIPHSGTTKKRVKS